MAAAGEDGNLGVHRSSGTQGPGLAPVARADRRESHGARRAGGRAGGRAERERSGRRVTRIAFAVIVLFVLAQVSWWIIFQQRYLSSVTEERLDAWQRDAATATALLQASPGAATQDELLARYPHLRVDGGQFVVDEGARQEFLSRQRGYIRMFAFELPFFVLVVLLSLLLIASSLRSERELKRRQQNFLSAVTHEFKTPISTLRLLIETALLRAQDPEQSRDYLERMAGEVARLEQTAEQVLASARLEQATEAVAMAPHDLSKLVERTVEGLRHGLEARGARLRLEFTEEPLIVSIDEDAFTVALGNLLDNAVKYDRSETKPVTVRVVGGTDVATVHVEDEGIGIPPGEDSRIFERFYRSGDEMTRDSQGIGLGLHLVKSSVEAMNGWVRAANREDAPGSRFTIVLPRRQDRGTETRSTETRSTGTEGSATSGSATKSSKAEGSAAGGSDARVEESP